MKPKIYLETSVIGYLTSRPSRDLVTAANQQLTRDWWDDHRSRFELVISEAVLAECGAGDATAADERSVVLVDIPTLDITDEVKKLADDLVNRVPLPPKAEVDAVHIAVAAMNGIDFLLTWNCTHIANAALLRRIESICKDWGVEPPTICTPQQLMEG